MAEIKRFTPLVYTLVKDGMDINLGLRSSI